MATTTNGPATLTFPSDTELLITRTFNAPRDLVFAAWTKPEHVRNWYGGKGANMTTCEIDLRVGGQWRYVITAPDGTEHAFSGEFREIEAPHRLVQTERYEPIADSEHLVTATFEEADGRTTTRALCSYPSIAHRDGHVNSGMEPGMNATLDALEEQLAAMAR